MITQPTTNLESIKLFGQEFVTKSTARNLLGYANTNSIDSLISKNTLRVFALPALRRKLIPLSDIQKLPRFHSNHNDAQELRKSS